MSDLPPVVLTVTADHLWLNTEQAAAMLGYDARVFRERVSLRPGFPQPLRLDGRGHPKWNAGELHAWALAERQRTGGRPRKRAA